MYLNNVGPPDHSIALSSLTLTFCSCGHVRQTTGDDTGDYDTYGSWSLERTDHGDVLILPAGFIYHGPFSIKYLEKEKAIYLGIGAADRALRLQNMKTENDPCTPPNLLDRASMPNTKLAEALTKGSWEYETNAGTPSNPIARERRTLTFCPCVHVRERFRSDSTTADLYGKWALESTDHGDVLILSDGYLVDRGRFSIKYLEKENAIDLSIGSAAKTLRFQSVKRERDPCTPAK